MIRPIFYARPLASGRDLAVVPAVASWDVAGSRGQLRSAAFIDAVGEAVADQAATAAGPLALQLDVGLPNTARLYA